MYKEDERFKLPEKKSLLWRYMDFDKIKDLLDHHGFQQRNRASWLQYIPLTVRTP